MPGLSTPRQQVIEPEHAAPAGVSQEERRTLTEPQNALELVDRVRGEGLPG